MNFTYDFHLCELDPERKKPKCAKYWPSKENETKSFDHMEIKLLGKCNMIDDTGNPIPEIIHRSLEVRNGMKGI